MKHLNAEAKNRGYATWWALKENLKPADVKTLLEEASKQEEMEKKEALRAGG